MERAKLILVAEDDPSSRELIAEILRARGYEVQEAGDGTAALQALGDQLPDLAIVDIQMPTTDGFTLLRDLRARPGGPELPVLAISAHAMRGARDRALAAGFTDYVTKPIEVMPFRQRVDALLQTAVSGPSPAADDQKAS